MKSTKKEVEALKTEITGLKIRLRRVEAFLITFPDPDDYLHDTSSEDELYEEAKEIVSKYDMASASLLQRRLMVGYARAASILDKLEEDGVIGPGEGGKPRKVLKKK